MYQVVKHSSNMEDDVEKSNYRIRLSNQSKPIQRLGKFIVIKCADEMEALTMERFLNKAISDPNLLAHLAGEQTVPAINAPIAQA